MAINSSNFFSALTLHSFGELKWLCVKDFEFNQVIWWTKEIKMTVCICSIEPLVMAKNGHQMKKKTTKWMNTTTWSIQFFHFFQFFNSAPILATQLDYQNKASHISKLSHRLIEVITECSPIQSIIVEINLDLILAFLIDSQSKYHA